MTKVSVVVPVYKVEKYLRGCLDSLVNQTLDDIEIIVVNDGSPDNCQSIIDEYVGKYNFVKSVIKENGGLGDARNVGITYATGEYIGFIDSDDTVEPDMYEKMYNKAVEDDADMVVCDLEYVWEDHSRENQYMAGFHQLENTEERKCMFLSPLFAWNKLYRREWFINSGLKYSVGKWYEDIPVTVPLFALANRISYVNQVMVHYLQRGSSIMGSGYDPRMVHIFDQMEFIYQYYKEHGLLEQYKEEIEYLFIEDLMLYGAFRFLRTDHYKELCSRSFEMMKKYFPDFRKNRYIQSLGLKNKIFIKTLNPATMTLYKKVLERRG